MSEIGKGKYWGVEAARKVFGVPRIQAYERPKPMGPIEFARTEWPGQFDWLSAKEDRGHFLEQFSKKPQDSLIMGGKETAKSLDLSLLSIWLQAYTKFKTIGVIAGSEDQAKVTYAHIRRLLLSGVHTRYMLESEPKEVEVNLLNGGRTWVYAASYYRAHGEHPHVLMADEAVLASRHQGGEILRGALASVTAGGFRIMASAPYFNDPIFMDSWDHAEERGWRRFGPWLKHPWKELKEPFRTQVNRRPWLHMQQQADEARKAMLDPHSKYRVFWMAQLEAGVGDVFTPELVDLCIEDYEIKPTRGASKSLGIDTGFGASRFAVAGVEERDSDLFVIMAEDYERPNFNEMANAVQRVHYEDEYDSCFVDASNPSFIEQLGHMGIGAEGIPFSKDLPDMIGQTQWMVERRAKKLRGGLHIDRGFTELIRQLKAAQWAKGGRKIDKTVESFDQLDALLCALRRWAKPVPEVAVAR